MTWEHSERTHSNWTEAIRKALQEGKVTTEITFDKTRYLITLQPREEKGMIMLTPLEQELAATQRALELAKDRIAELSKVMDFKAHAREAFENSRNHGFHDAIAGKYQIPLRLLLIITEATEAVAEFRIAANLAHMPDDLVEELADIYIRLGDLVYFPEIGIDRFERAVNAKLEKNRDRPRLHGGKRI